MSVTKGRGGKWGREHGERGRKGRYVKSTPCDACGKPTGRAYATDDEVCEGGDGPGFYLCIRARCTKRLEVKTMAERRAIYEAQRAANEASSNSTSRR